MARRLTQAARAAKHGSSPYLMSLAAVGLVSLAIGVIETRFRIANLSMLYLLAVLAAATLAGRGPAIVASITAFLAFDWFFVEPLHTFSVADPEEWFALVLFLATATITGQLAADQRHRAEEAHDREREAVLLYEAAGLLAEPDLDAGCAGVGRRLLAELPLAAVVIEVRDDLGASRIAASCGDAVAVSAATQPGARSVKVLGMPARHAATWVRVVAPGRAVLGSRYADRVHVVPLGTPDHRLGALLVVRGNRARLGAGDGRVLAGVGAQLTVALERHRLRQLATEREVLRRGDQLKTALLGAVSHDLRTPLAAIIASAGSLRQRDVEWTADERDEFALDIEEAARRLSRIVTNLLDLSRIEGGSLRPDRGWYDLGALVDDVVGRLRGAIAERDLGVVVPAALPPVFLDYVEIDQVLSNLIENAVRYSPAGSPIDIDVAVIGDTVSVAIADRGPGLPAEALGRLFDPFYRVPVRRGPSGTGLGLAVARGLVEAHGGAISVENRADGGAKFTFTLPADRAVAERAPSVSR
ncbi:MAG: hypothetical protein NVS9B6_18330 [Candidatus Limnocylindrales bacterium]